MRTLVLAEHNASELNANTLNTVTCATALGLVDVLVVGHDCVAVAKECAAIEGVGNVLCIEDAKHAHPLAETLAPILCALGDNYEALLAPASTFGKNIMPRVAALLDVQQISDVCEVIDENTFKRPIYAGNAIATVRSCDAKKVITVRTTAFDAALPTGGSAAIQSLSFETGTDLSTFVSSQLTQSDRPELTSSSVIVSGGRGLGSIESFALLEQLADTLDAAIGASRAAVDAGFAPNDYQIGQTGKVVAPDLYIAVGISGAIQHLAGMKDSRIIVAINNDPDAPIFKVADYGLVADLFEVLPELAQALEQ